MEEKSLWEMVKESLDKTKTKILINPEDPTIKITLPKTSVYDSFIANNRDHQIKALEAIAKYVRGQIILPTGTGKTRVQVAMIVLDMLTQAQNGTYGVYVIASHRLLLNKQLMDELLDLCLKCQLPVNALYVGSSRHDDKEVYANYFKDIVGNFKADYTTSGSEIKKFADNTKNAGRHLIVVSTYHSFDRLSSLDSIDICAYDEAHNTTEENFHDNIQEVIGKIKRNYFFTATRKICSINGYGMEDESIYGEVIAEISPTEMINEGEIVRPKIITMFIDEDPSPVLTRTGNSHMLVKTVTEAFTRSKEAMKADSSNPDALGNKMIVSSEGSDELKVIQESPEFQAWCIANHVRVFSFSSRYGSFIGDAPLSPDKSFLTSISRDKVYEALKSLTDKEDAIFLHIDILTEGIDLPTITSILLMRNLNEISLFQTLGRGLRLTLADRVGLYHKQITKEQFVKRFAYLVLPLHFEKMDTSSADMKQTIQKVVGTFGIPVEEFLPPEGFPGKKFPPGVPKKYKLGKDYPLISVIEDFIIGEVTKDLPKDSKGLYDTLMTFFKKIGGKNA